MKKAFDIKKFCPVCQAFSFSLTKKNCDFCNANLWDMKNFKITSASGYRFIDASKVVELRFEEEHLQ